MNLSAYIQCVFPRKHRFYSFLYGFAIASILIMPRPGWISKAALVAIYCILVLVLVLCFHFGRPKEPLEHNPNGWGALGLATSGILFEILSVFDWLTYLNNPIAMILAGGLLLLICMVYELWQIKHLETD